MAWTTRQQIKALKNAYETLDKASGGLDLKVLKHETWYKGNRGLDLKRMSLRGKKHSQQIKCLLDKIGYIGDLIDRQARRTENQGQPRGCYDFVPSSNERFADTLLMIMRYHKVQSPSHHPLRFIDAGCGIGTKVIIAEAMGYRAEGLEISTKLIEEGKKLFQFNGTHPRVRQGDIRNHNYSKYNIIYFFCPLSSHKQEKFFEKLVWNQAKVGSYVIANANALTPSNQKFIGLSGTGYGVRTFLKYAP